MENLEGRINQLGKDIADFLEKTIPGTTGKNGFSPSVDIYESEGTLILIMDLPGMEREQVSVTCNDRILTITGERISEVPEEVEFIKNERRFGRFSRSFSIPHGANSSEIKAKFSRGILRVSVPLNENQKSSTHIDIE
jgi:HSP20 family protein